jgi:hypothetical protein
LIIEEGKEYLAVGEYEIIIAYNSRKITHKNKRLVQKIIVQDTTPPKLEVPEFVELEYGTNIEEYDFESLMTATDLSELGEYIIDTSNVDTSVPGEYIVKVSISDIHGNIAEKEFIVIVKEQEVEEATVQTNTTPQNNNNGNSNSSNNNNSNSSRPNNNNTNSNNSGQGNSNNQGSNNSGTTTTPPTTPSQPERVQCTEATHRATAGNTGRWFNTRAEAVAHYTNTIRMWEQRVQNGEVTFEEYGRNSPAGYAVWSCAFCNQWTIDFHMR